MSLVLSRPRAGMFPFKRAPHQSWDALPGSAPTANLESRSSHCLVSGSSPSNKHPDDHLHPAARHVQLLEAACRRMRVIQELSKRGEKRGEAGGERAGVCRNVPRLPSEAAHSWWTRNRLSLVSKWLAFACGPMAALPAKGDLEISLSLSMLPKAPAAAAV